jgi:hypothetical protein
MDAAGGLQGGRGIVDLAQPPGGVAEGVQVGGGQLAGGPGGQEPLPGGRPVTPAVGVPGRRQGLGHVVHAAAPLSGDQDQLAQLAADGAVAGLLGGLQGKGGGHRDLEAAVGEQGQDRVFDPAGGVGRFLERCGRRLEPSRGRSAATSRPSSMVAARMAGQASGSGL